MIPHINGPHTSKTTSDFTEMVGDLRRQADANKDGSVSAAEFSDFLDQLTRESVKEAGGQTACAPEGRPAGASRG